MKYKLTAKYSLEYIDLATIQTQVKSIENDHLANDLRLIKKINELSKCIVSPHQVSLRFNIYKQYKYIKTGLVTFKIDKNSLSLTIYSISIRFSHK
jgi:hypothetical protein